jgi:hypothetical protein
MAWSTLPLRRRVELSIAYFCTGTLIYLFLTRPSWRLFAGTLAGALTGYFASQIEKFIKARN